MSTDNEAVNVSGGGWNWVRRVANKYLPEEDPPAVGSQYDDGTMPENVQQLARAVVGHRVVDVETEEPRKTKLLLDDGSVVTLKNTDDCCAFTSMESVVSHLPRIDHVITRVEARDGYNRWFLMADAGAVLELTVGWSAGNPFYYMYGFEIDVESSS